MKSDFGVSIPTLSFDLGKVQFSEPQFLHLLVELITANSNINSNNSNDENAGAESS